MDPHSGRNPDSESEPGQLEKVCQDQQREIEGLKTEFEQLEQQVVLSSSRVSALHHISLVLLSKGNMEELSNSILDIIAGELQVDSCSLMLRENEVLMVRAARGLPKGIASNATRGKGEGISGLVFETGRSVWARDIEEHPALAYRRIHGKRYSTKSFVSAPIEVQGRLIGVLNISDKKNRKEFTEEEVSFVETVARQVGIVLENVRIQERNRQLAITDEMTGLYNFRHFQGALAVEMERARRYQRRGLSLIMADIDQFKAYNDSHGHQEGDYVLKRVAKVLQEESRKVDVVSRYGGEEFAVILPEIDKQDALVYAERVRKKIEEMQERDSRVLQQITISSGIAEYPADGNDQSDLIRSADQALYNAKAAGRNRTTLYRRGTEPLL